MQLRILTCLLLLVSVCGLLFVSAWVTDRMAPESTPVSRGANYAEVRNCVSCHGDPENPQSDANNMACSNVNTMPWHPDYNVVCTDVMAYFETVRVTRTFVDRAEIDPENPLIKGERLAREYHCFRCHGHLGQGGFANAGSLKGYIPGYFGNDFSVLTSDTNPEAVREWIMHGINSKIVGQPITGSIAKYFFDRQAVHMPSFKTLPPEAIEILVHYVIALHKFGPMNAKTVRAYSEQSQLCNLPDSICNYSREDSVFSGDSARIN